MRLLPYAAAFSLAAAPTQGKGSPRARRADPAQALHGINVASGLPTGLKDLGLREQHSRRSSRGQTQVSCPRPCSPADIRR
jgi:hypothetical protein